MKSAKNHKPGKAMPSKISDWPKSKGGTMATGNMPKVRSTTKNKKYGC